MVEPVEEVVYWLVDRIFSGTMYICSNDWCSNDWFTNSLTEAKIGWPLRWDWHHTSVSVRLYWTCNLYYVYLGTVYDLPSWMYFKRSSMKSAKCGTLIPLWNQELDARCTVFRMSYFIFQRYMVIINFTLICSHSNFNNTRLRHTSTTTYGKGEIY